MHKNFFNRLTQVVNIDSENSVIVAAPTYGQTQDANSKAMVIKVGMDGNGSATFDTNQLERLLMYACITEWGGPAFDGRPVTEENIDALPTFVMALLRPAINELTKGVTEEEKKQ
jgi:hypothetical protein